MTFDSWQKGSSLLDELSMLKTQLEKLSDEKNLILSHCKDHFNNEVIETVKPIEKALRKQAKDAVQKKINQLEKEFKAL